MLGPAVGHLLQVKGHSLCSCGDMILPSQNSLAVLHVSNWSMHAGTGAVCPADVGATVVLSQIPHVTGHSRLTGSLVSQYCFLCLQMLAYFSIQSFAVGAGLSSLQASMLHSCFSSVRALLHSSSGAAWPSAYWQSRLRDCSPPPHSSEQSPQADHSVILGVVSALK